GTAVGRSVPSPSGSAATTPAGAPYDSFAHLTLLTRSPPPEGEAHDPPPPRAAPSWTPPPPVASPPYASAGRTSPCDYCRSCPIRHRSSPAPPVGAERDKATP